MIMKNRKDSIVAVTVVKYATMYVEADTPEEAYEYAKKYCSNVPDSSFEDSDVYVDSCENYTSGLSDEMDEVWVEDGKTLTFYEYRDELEEAAE
jgi:hypothetical protein